MHWLHRNPGPRCPTAERGDRPVSLTFAFDNSYARELDGFYMPWKVDPAPAPELLLFNRELADELGIDPAEPDPSQFTGNAVPTGAEPLAQAYAGHQFGGFSPQLGDGRALLLGEVIDRSGNRRDIQLKGSGKTPFSRGGDGKAALGPVLREYLMGEAMHALGIPTTRALAAVATGEKVHRETPLPGAVLARVAASHIRVGTFQFFAARQEFDKVRQLADYTIARHYPKVAGQENPYLSLLYSVSEKQAALLAQWINVGFVHGVMNTDNMTLSGETIDYGPCAFMDVYEPQTVYSSIDLQGRYAYANQPLIARWNLARFAETILSLIDDDQTKSNELATKAIDGFAGVYETHWLAGMRAKLGLSAKVDGDLDLANGFLAALERQNVDFTAAFRALAEAATGDDGPVLGLLSDPSLYSLWSEKWRNRLELEAADPAARAAAMNRVNPIYIPRNHKVEEALSAAVDKQDLTPFKALLEVVKHPYTDRTGLEAYTGPAPESFGAYKTFCGT
ncbi:MAG: YdiU family protein [Rhodobacteraceae bacterium]|nr:YdiU family protein [Paracoccaceae bacterium]